MSKRRKFSKEFKESLLREHDETGISYWKLGKKYGIEAGTIRRCVITGMPLALSHWGIITVIYAIIRTN